MFLLNPLSGYTFDTEFTVVISPTSNNDFISWGDGNYFNGSSATHTYDKNGSYEITIGNCSAVSAFNINVYNLFENKIEAFGTELSTKNIILTLDIDNDIFPDGFTFSRNSSASYIAEDGSVKYVGINEMRLDHYINGRKYLLLEGTKTNIVDQNVFDQHVGAHVTDFTVISNIPAPDGSLNALRVERIPGSPLDGDFCINFFTTSSVGTYTMSVWMKSNIGNFQSNISVQLANGAGWPSQNIEITSDWKRYDFTFFSPFSGEHYARWFLHDPSIPFMSLDIWGQQVEEGFVATSFIDTYNQPVPAIRAIDSASINGITFTPQDDITVNWKGHLSKSASIARLFAIGHFNDKAYLLNYANWWSVFAVVEDSGIPLSVTETYVHPTSSISSLDNIELSYIGSLNPSLSSFTSEFIVDGQLSSPIISTYTLQHHWPNNVIYFYDLSQNDFSIGLNKFEVYSGIFDSQEINYFNSLSYDSLSSFTGCPKSIVLNISSTEPKSTVFLYSSGSNSIPYSEDRTFWSHLNPEWEFRYDGKVVSELEIEGDPVYINNQVIGYSAQKIIDYIDDMTGNPTLFFTLMKNEGDVLINSRSFDTLSVHLSSPTPSHLCITSDGINKINELQWADLKIPYVVSVCGDDSSCGTIIHNASGYLTDIKIIQDCYGIDAQSYQTIKEEMNLYDDCYPIGGYILNNLFVPSSAIPSNELINNYDPTCGTMTPEDIIYQVVRHSPLGVTISATGVFDIDGTIYTLSGVSNPFNVYRLENFNAFYRKGEDKNIYDLIKKFSHWDLKELPTLNGYLSTIAGEGDTLGKVYDKIVNFHKDHSDIDICNIDNIKDIASKLDVPVDDFGLDFPEELGRYMDFFSIPLQKLIGTRCVCNNVFDCQGCCGKNICSICGFNKKSSIGKGLTINDYVTAGQTILIKENGSETYDFLYIPNTSLVRDITASPVLEKGIGSFCFNQWNQTPQGNPVESVINYNDPRTTLNRNLSSADDFYGDNGVIEEIINFILTEKLIDE